MASVMSARFKEALWRVAGWTPDGALLLRVEQSEQPGATWLRDLERSRVVALNKDILVVDILRDATVAEVIEPISLDDDAFILGTMVKQVDFTLRANRRCVDGRPESWF